MLESGPSFAQVAFMHQFIPAPRTSQVNKAVSLVETVVATGGLLIPTESEKEICDVYVQQKSLITGLEYGMNQNKLLS